MATGAVCFHNRKVCAWCFPRGNHTARAQRPPARQPHCPGCGRFVPRGWSLCPPCMRLSLIAPRLPLAG